MIDISHILGRAPFVMDESRVRDYLAGKHVVITGAAGSIGAHVASVVAGMPLRLTLMDRDESGLFHVAADVKPDDAIVASLPHNAPPIRDAVVIHCAAHKHVPLTEGNIMAAVSSNVMATEAVCCWPGCDVTLVSTDKAVEPASVMGATKLIAERIVLSHGGRVARFGNVLGTRGSVLDVWSRLSAQGRSIPITDPTMTRYFMSVDEAAALVLTATTLGGGSVYTLDMGEPVSVGDLARSWGVGDSVEVVGARPGERLHERITADHESLEDTECQGVMRCL